MKAIIVHNIDDENTRYLIPIDNINLITECIEDGDFVTKIWMKTPCNGGTKISVLESLNDLYEKYNK